MTDAQIKIRDFESQLHFFNGMYKLPVGAYPTSFAVINYEVARKPMVDWHQREYLCRRITDFMSILRKEVIEGDDIIQKLKLGKHEVLVDGEQHMVDYTELDFLTDMADWLGDIQVYCGSEMVKYGIPLKETLRIIMSSNFSKLGRDGNPIYDEEGKVQKGPMYWKPEPQLRIMLEEKIMESHYPKAPNEIIWGGAK